MAEACGWLRSVSMHRGKDSICGYYSGFFLSVFRLNLGFQRCCTVPQNRIASQYPLPQKPIAFGRARLRMFKVNTVGGFLSQNPIKKTPRSSPSIPNYGYYNAYSV